MQQITWSPVFAGVLASVAFGAAAAMPAMPGMGGASPEWAAFGEPGRVADRTIAITAIDTRYKSDAVQIRRGETVRFMVSNQGRVAHEFVIGDAAFQAQHQREMQQMPGMKMDDPNELDLKPGQTRSLTWRFTRAGEFLYACDLPGHAQAGMVGHIHVR
ncbi:MAG TPA: cupredoxin family protein [Caulobacteraceae bacterium]|nr:cupredoxin family protein [Caulobacteraceae bacterium]